MTIIDFTQKRQQRLMLLKKEKQEPAARMEAMKQALEKENLTDSARIIQYHALITAYDLVRHSPDYGSEPAPYSILKQEADTTIRILADFILLDSFMEAPINLAGRRMMPGEVSTWAARRLILDYILILIDDASSPDDWLDPADNNKKPLAAIFQHLGYPIDQNT